MVAGLYGDDRVGKITLCTRGRGFRPTRTRLGSPLATYQESNSPRAITQSPPAASLIAVPRRAEQSASVKNPEAV